MTKLLNNSRKLQSDSSETSFFTISFLLSTFLDWNVTFEAIALQKPALDIEIRGYT